MANLYLVRDEDTRYYVEAESYGDAVEVWCESQGKPLPKEPDSVTLKGTVIRRKG